MVSLRMVGLLAIVCAGLAACSTTQQTGAAAFASPSVASVDPASLALIDDSLDYRIGPMDILDISVFNVPELTKTVQVSGSGLIVLPLIGNVPAAGKTTDQLQKQIASLLGAKYLQSPQVTVFVSMALSQQVTIEGAVAKPGVFPMGGGKTGLLQAMALAGGVTEVADTKNMVILRTVNGQRQAAKFDFDSIRAGKTADPVVLAGDVIVVDSSGLKSAWKGLKDALPVLGAFRLLP